MHFLSKFDPFIDCIIESDVIATSRAREDLDDESAAVHLDRIFKGRAKDILGSIAPPAGPIAVRSEDVALVAR